MAQLKDLIVNGASHLIGNTSVNKIYINTIDTSNGIGSANQVLTSNGTSVYWADNIITTIASTTGSGNVITAITASNGALTITKGGYAPTTAGTANQICVSTGTTPGWKATANGAAYATSANGALTFGTLPVAQGGTGATSFTTGQALIGADTGAITTRGIVDNTSVGALGWTSGNNKLITVNTLAYWDGRYGTSNNNSNLEYCKLGKLGDMATKTASNYVLKAGDTMTGKLIVKGLAGTSGVDYGSTFPSSPTTGTIFFKASDSTSTIYATSSTAKAYTIGVTSTGNGEKSLVFNPSVYTEGSVLYGAAWNDYAEYRKDNIEEKHLQEPGRCVREIGNGILTLTNDRLQRGCEIISDTFGFAIGQDKEKGYNTPIATSGRVLAYLYEDNKIAKSFIGYPVCSGPNGTVSIMSEEEENKYPSRIIGTISEIPDYEEWGTEKIKVNGRIWIRIR